MESIGRYRILDELGRGAMGVVYRALDPAIGRTVAIKTIRLSDFADADERAKLRERLFREAQSAGILSHPGIVTIYDIAEAGDLAYIAMECVDGPTLSRMMAEDPPDARLVLTLLSQTAAALDYAHKRGIVHRDIKPANIMVHQRSQAKITDFGVAKIQSHQMTHAGAMIGTPNYMSPEQIQGRPVDGRSDQYSLAVIAYELLTGEKPFAADSLAALAFKIVHEDPSPVHRLNPTLGWTVDTVVRKGLAKDPAGRYPTCSDFVFALENACRACKDWKPLAAGASQDLATVVETGGPPPKSPVVPDPVTPPARAPRPTGPSAATPLLLRIARLMALVVAGGAVASGLLVLTLRYLAGRSETAAQSPAPVEATAPSGTRPSPLGEPAATLPGDAPAETASTASAAPDKPAEPVPETPARPAPAPPPQAPAPNALRGAIPARLVTNPPGAFLVVDGRSETSCTSPCTLPLPPGRHTLSATKEGFRKTLKILELPQDAETFLNLERMSGTVVVRSEPRGAAIYLNGQARSEKTPAMLTLPTGRYVVELEFGGHRERQDVEVRDSVITNVAVNFPER